jgi:cobalt-precorrin 5A hydrolase
MIAIGIGLKSGATSSEIVTLVEEGLSRVERETIAGLFTLASKAHESGLSEAAAILSLPLLFLPEAALKNVACRTESRSERVVALFGVPSIAETAALVGAGEGSSLILPRISRGGVTCAIAKSAGDSA